MFEFFCCTTILYRASTGPDQGFPCAVFPHREKLVFNTGFPGVENRFFPVRNTTQGKPCFHYRDGFAVSIQNIFDPIVEVDGVVMSKNGTDESDHALK